MNNLGSMNSNTGQSKSYLWLWVLIIIVVIAALGLFGWKYYSAQKTITANTATPVSGATTSPASDLNAVDNDLSKLDNNFNQLDKIDASQDQTPNL